MTGLGLWFLKKMGRRQGIARKNDTATSAPNAHPIAHAQLTPEKPMKGTSMYTNATRRIKSVNVEMVKPRLPPQPRTTPSHTIFTQTTGRNEVTITMKLQEYAKASAVSLSASTNSRVKNAGAEIKAAMNTALVMRQ